MSALVVGDIHIKAKKILPRIDMLLNVKDDISRIVFCGDYCDDWNISSQAFEDDIIFLVKWVTQKREEGYIVDLVFGNHDLQYLLRCEGPGTKEELYDFVNETLFSLNMRIAHDVDGFLVTHAGLTRSWAEKFLDGAEEGILDIKSAVEQLNMMLDSGDSRTWDYLNMIGYADGGFDVPSPLWSRTSDLLFDSVDNISQIVGHTPVKSACMASQQRTGKDKQIWFCDTFSTRPNGSACGDETVLIVDDGDVSIVTLPLPISYSV